MVEVVKTILEFLLIFLLIYGGYYLFSFKKIKKYNRNKAPINVKYLVNRYNLDVVRLGYKRVCKILMIADSFIVTLTFIVTKIVDNLYLRLFVAFILIFPFFAGIYHIVAIYFKKEEMK